MPVVEAVCTTTAKGQTTVPKAVRQALGVGYGGRIAFRVEGDRVTVHALPNDNGADPALGPFLALLEADLASRLEERTTVQPLTPALAARLEALAGGSDEGVDLEAPIEGEVTL